MKRTRFALPTTLTGALRAPLVHAQSISINATSSGEIVSGVHGQVILGGAPPPPVVYAQPVIVQPAPVLSARRPCSRSTYMCLPGTRSTGKSIVRSITPATGRTIALSQRNTSPATAQIKNTGITSTTTMDVTAACGGLCTR
jgi:hypothetical protein